MRRFYFVIGIISLILLVACEPDTSTVGDGPRLVSDVTLAPSINALDLPTLAFSPTPPRLTEVISPLDSVTVDAQFVLVTPTLPPSKTPTLTPTQTQTQPPTNTPTVTVTATTTAPVLPTSVIIPVTSVVVQPVTRVCDRTWFFIQPRPEACPINPPLADQGVYQRFENGYMIWVRRTDSIYVMYNDQVQPRWQVFRDYFNEGMPEEGIGQSPPSGRWEPRRGFGMLWRANEAVRNRIGWATQQWEQPYSVQAQTSDEGVIFLSDPYSAIFGLVPNYVNWTLYAGS